MLNKIRNPNAFVYGGLFLLAFFVVFKSCLNPFGLMDIDSDTSVYLTIAQGITRGEVPYRDFFDNKGPLLYLLSVPGFFLGGLAGVWITELILMYVSVFFAYKTALFFGGKRTAFWGTVFTFTVFQSFLYEVAGTEEYSLPFMMISLFIFVKHYFHKKETPVHEIALAGFCCAAAFFIRINMFPLWFGFCILIIIEYIIKKKYLLLIKYTLSFCIGFMAAAIAVFIYLHINNIFGEYVLQNFMAGGSRGLSGFSVVELAKSFYLMIEKNYCFLPLFVYLVWIVKPPKKISVYLSSGLLLSYLLSVFWSAIIGTNYDHYNMVFAPFLVPVFTFCVEFAVNYFSGLKYRKAVLILFFFVMFLECFMMWCYDALKVKTDTGQKNTIAAGKIIEQNSEPGDTVMSLGKTWGLYLFTERKAASRFIYQGSGVNYYPGAREEFLRDMRENTPKIIGIFEIDGSYDYLPEWYSPVFEMIENDYTVLYSENHWRLFIRN